MSAINLEKSIARIKKCYVGKDEDGKHVIDSSKMKDDLAFSFALTRISMAIKNKEITEEDFLSELEE